MKSIYKIALFGLLLGLLVYMYKLKFNRAESSRSSNILLVGTNAEFAPFSFMDNGQIVGFDIDVAQEVAKRLGKTIKFKDMPFESLLPELQLGRIEMIAAGITPTPERAQKVLFTKPYVEGDKLVVLTRRNTPLITSLDDLSGKKVVVNDGFTADLYMSTIKGPELIRFPTTAEAILALRNGNVDAYVTSYNPVKQFFSKQPEFELFTIPDQNESTAIVISKKHSDLLSQVDAVLDQMKKDGTIAKIKTKWGLLT